MSAYKKFGTGSPVLPWASRMAPFLMAAPGMAIAGVEKNGSNALNAVDGKTPISESSCRAGSFDYTERFPADREQGPLGQCFAFAAVGLLDEHGYASGKVPFGTQFSAIDVARDYPDMVNPLTGEVDVGVENWSRDYFNLVYTNQGGVEFQLIDAALSFGVCRETDAPYFPVLEGACGKYSNRHACMLDGLKRLWKRYSRIRRRLAKTDNPGAEDALLPWEREAMAPIVEELGIYLRAQIEGGLDVERTLRASFSAEDFIERALLPPSCEVGRVRIGGLSWHVEWATNWVVKNQETIVLADGYTRTFESLGEPGHHTYFGNWERFHQLSFNALRYDRSVALGLCSKSALIPSRSRKDDARDREFCGPHALIANGIRWNSDRYRCEVHLRNSWGPENPLQGWLPIEPVLNSTFRISGIILK